MNRFIEKVFSDKKLVKLLFEFRNVEWKKLNSNEKINVLNDVANGFNEIYGNDLGRCKFYFIDVNSDMCGETLEDYNIINLNSLGNNQFSILSTILHELRHYYQDKAHNLYKSSNVIHELFADVNYLDIFKNDENSEMFRAENYVAFNDNNFIEYCIQPTEYDAESFSKEFMIYFADNYLEYANDIEMCLGANPDFDAVCRIIKKDDRDIINFNRKYELNYQDYISENKEIFIKDEVRSWKYKELFNNFDNISKENLSKLCCPCFWYKYDNSIRVKILNKYCELCDADINVVLDDGNIVINGKTLGVKDVFKVMELLFNELADYEIMKIVKKKNPKYLMRVEREIRLNLKNDRNMIKKEENPLFYEVQPYMLFKNNYVLRSFYDFYRNLDSMYDTDNNFFESFSNYIAKYDVESMMKKVRILTGMKFDDFYDLQLKKMSSRKTR